jgi:hypothetical protein
VGGSTITANPSSGFVIGSQTLFAGSAITSGAEVITLPLPTTMATQPVITNVVVGSATLTPGGSITVGGDILSLAPSGTSIFVVGTVTVGGGEATATATNSSKKSSGERMCGNRVLVALHFFAFIVYYLH